MTTMLKSSLCEFSDAYILVKRFVSVANVVADADANYIKKMLIFKN